MNSPLRLGTRGSKLALTQSGFVADLIKQKTSISVELVVISTKGDRVLDKPLAEIGGKGLFTFELESALLSNDIDFAVHSLKDLPTEDPDGLMLAAIPPREDPRDAIVGVPVHQATVLGTGSARRCLQSKRLNPNVKIVDIRGNVDTRLAKLDNGQYDAIVLAMAGLKRLDIRRNDIRPLSVKQMIPAPGQGALAIQCNAKNQEIVSLLQKVHDLQTSNCVTAERTFLAQIGGGCNVAAGCYVSFSEGLFYGHAFVSTDSYKQASLFDSSPHRLGERLASVLG